MNRISVFVPYPIEGPSSRYRIYQYAKPLQDFGFQLSFHSIMTKQVYQNRVNGKKSNVEDMLVLSKNILERIYKTLSTKNTITIVQRELSPVFRGVLHKFLAQSIDGPLIYDFDDAVFTEYDINEILKRANFLTPGNGYLLNYARKINTSAHATIIPTVVDTQKYMPQASKTNDLVVGWIGTESSYKRYLAPRLKEFSRITQKYGAIISVIGPRIIAADVTSKGAEFVEWSLETETANMARFHVGLMPLFDDEYTRGKCAFKLIEYGAFATPSIASAVGANNSVILDKNTGFLVNTDQEWEQAFDKLLTDPRLRREMGDAARERVVEHYSLQSQVPVWAEILHAATKLLR
jgi:glycosyltransferase involved in cell wall biosynthesis